MGYYRHGTIRVWSCSLQRGNLLAAVQGDQLEDLVSAPQIIMQQFLERHFPTKQSSLKDDVGENDLNAILTMARLLM